MTRMIDYAMGYLQHKWAIIPRSLDSKMPLIKWKPFQVRRPTEREVYTWWHTWPEAGIGLVLGPVSGVVAVDSDSEAAHRAFLERLDQPPTTLAALSGSRKPGKKHYFYQSPTFSTNATRRIWHPELEFRGQGGYIVLPPSLHSSGHRYEWVNPSQQIQQMPEELAIAWQGKPSFQAQTTTRLPASINYSTSRMTLLQLLRVPMLARSTSRWLQGDYSQASAWNSRLFTAACDLAGLGICQETAEPHLLKGAAPNSSADESMARSTIASAYSAPRSALITYNSTRP